MNEHQPAKDSRRDLGFWMVVVGFAAVAFGMAGFSLIPFIMLLIGLATILIGLIVARPTGRRLIRLLAASALAIGVVWLALLIVAIAD